jgi:hypothetical protein
VQETAEPVSSCDLDVGVDGAGERPQWAGLMQRAMRAVPVEMALVFDAWRARPRGAGGYEAGAAPVPGPMT